ncbi:dimethylamine:corrinoid methyltransferase [Desulfocicer vacuolatum DSM 3385]|uniref:Dimethylamine:corrinoid methyltransferase n=1 Tax=Desulfocicer vacuolatum DSM 3385 TaxID=1121400 RepID=A0A1W2CXK7_9BACT|nr:dimethylamine:corrinoid methyltransferase [Desulfocicer vacuolatum DSM 3385]
MGDPVSMAITHAHASGMGGMRGAGDLVARAQMSRGMRTWEAKEYVAEKLKISVADLTDPVIMTEVREDLQIGQMTPMPGCAKGIEAKFNIARELDFNINCVNRFKTRTSI